MQVAQYALGKVYTKVAGKKDPYCFGFDAVSFANSVAADAENTKLAQGAIDALNLGSVCESMAISGTLVYSPGGDAVIQNMDIDEKTLAIRYASYNSTKRKPNNSLQTLLDDYYENGDVFNDYNSWYSGGDTGKNNSNSYAEAVKEALLVNDDIDIDNASLEQVIAAIGDVEDAIEELGYATVTEVNKDKVKEYIKEHPNE